MTVRPPRRSLNKLAALALAIATFGGCSTHDPGPGAYLLRPLGVDDASVNRSGTIARASIPDRDTPGLVRLGKPPTPVSVAAATETDDAVLVLLYESLSDLRLLAIDRGKTKHVDEVVIEGSTLTRHARRDVKRDHLAWIATSLQPALYRYNDRRDSLDKVLDVPGETHIWGFDQHRSGTIYLGTSPSRKLLRVNFKGDTPRVTEIPITVGAAKACTYVRDVFAADDALFVHCTSPGVLVRHDLKTGDQSVVLKTKRNSLKFRDGPNGLTVSDGDGKSVSFDRSGAAVASADTKSDDVNVTENRDRARIEWSDGSRGISLLPRGRGMRITCFQSMPDGTILGSTYWNAWVFRIDPRDGTMEGLGAIRKAKGEFFAFGSVGDEIGIPQYQGDVFLYDPARPWSETASSPNPRPDFESEAHYGLGCVTDEKGRFMYVTAPNYNQSGSMFIVRRKSGKYTVHERVGDDLILGPMVATSAGVFAGSYDQSGVGNRRTPPKPRPARVVRLSPDDGSVLDEVRLGSGTDDEVRGLVSLGGDRLLCATKQALHIIEAGGGQLKASAIPSSMLLARTAGGRTEGLATHGPSGAVLVLTKNVLAAYDPATDAYRVLARMPVEFEFMTTDDRGGVWLADDGEVFMLPAATVRRLLDAAGIAAPPV